MSDNFYSISLNLRNTEVQIIELNPYDHWIHYVPILTQIRKIPKTQGSLT